MTSHLRLASFNLENLDDRPGLDPPLERRIEVLRPQLLRLEADVLCLQEVHGQKPPGAAARSLLALDRLLEGTPYAAYARAWTRSAGRHASRWACNVHNLVVLSRFPIEVERQVREELVTPPRHRLVTARPPVEEPQPCGFDRPLLYARLRLPSGRALHLVNLHLRAPLAAAVPGQKIAPFAWRSVAGWAEGFFVAAVKRAGQALEARLFLERLFDEDPQALIAVAGDLNAEDREVPLRLLAAETADTGNGELAGRSLVPLDRSLPAERRFSVVHRGRRAMLDHILVSRPLLAHFRELEVHAETLDDELAPSERVAHATESYHAPIVAAFAMPS